MHAQSVVLAVLAQMPRVAVHAQLAGSAVHTQSVWLWVHTVRGFGGARTISRVRVASTVGAFGGAHGRWGRWSAQFVEVHRVPTVHGICECTQSVVMLEDK